MTAVCRRCRGEGYVGDGADMRLCPTCWGDGDNKLTDPLAGYSLGDGEGYRKHEPLLRYVCDDPYCCDNGGPVVTCRACHHRWPCPHRVERDSAAKTGRNERWVKRKVDGL